MTVKITIKSFTQEVAQSASIYFAQPDASGDWNWNQSSTAELVTGSQLTLTYSFADMVERLEQRWEILACVLLMQLRGVPCPILLTLR